MADPVEIYIASPDRSEWQKSVGWTSMSLSRSKDQLTGSLSISYFFGYVPQEPVDVDMARGREVAIYIAGVLAFRGIIDARQGKGSNADVGGTDRSLNIGPNEYTVSLTARGLSKQLIDNSHQIKTNLKGTTTRTAIEALIEPWGIEINWDSEEQEINILRLRDGARAFDEINRIAVENCHFIYEERNGKLRVTDGTRRESGDDLVLGRNILTFSATQSEVAARSSIIVKGQRNDSWGEAAVLPNMIEVISDDLLPNNNRKIVVQHYGNATEKSLKRRAIFEANKRNSESKTVTIEVFGVDSSIPWDIGLLHHTVIPCEGIDTILECTGVSYNCDSSGTLKTTLTLSPAPSGIEEVATGPLSSLPIEKIDSMIRSSSIKIVGNYPASWTPVDWSFRDVPIIGDVIRFIEKASGGIISVGVESSGTISDPPERIN